MAGGNEYYQGKSMVSMIANRRLGGVAVTETVRERFSNKMTFKQDGEQVASAWQCLKERHPEGGKISYRGIAFIDQKSQQFFRPESPSINTFSRMSGATISFLTQKTVENVLYNLVTVRGMRHNKISDNLSRSVHIHTQYASHEPKFMLP